MREAYNYDNIQEILIKALIANKESIPKISELINSKDFDNVKYKEIYLTLQDLQSANEDINPYTISLELSKKNVTFTQEDLTLWQDVPLENPFTIAQILRLKSIEKDAQTITSLANEELKANPNTLSVLGNLIDEAEKLTIRLTPSNEKSFKDAVLELGNDIIEGKEEDVFFIPTPYETLNGYIGGGFKENQLITVGARTGVGKTTVSTNCAATACALGKSVLFFSLEMARSELIKRLIACHGNIMLRHLEKGVDKPKDVLEKIKETAEEIANWKLEIKDEAEVTIEHIRAVAQQQAASENGLDMIIIDYLQLISTKDSKAKNRQEAVAEISRSCKMLAKQLGVPVMVLVQLNRESKDDGDKLPSKADIRESAAIAADSDIILIIHRKYRDDSADPKATFILDKNRGGPADRMFSVRSILEKNKFQDLKEGFVEQKEEASPAENFGQTTDMTFTDISEQEQMILDEDEIWSDLPDIDDDIFGDM